MSCSFRTVPTAIATVSPHTTHMSARRQSRGPLRVACTVLQPPKSALSTVPLKMNFRTAQRYRVPPGGTESRMRYTGDAYAGGVTRKFRDREDAGKALATALTDVDVGNAIVLGLPRGGVPVAAVVAKALGAPLDVVVVRKVGVPGHAELAMGAIASIAGEVVTVRNESVLRGAGSDALLRFEGVAERERTELERRQELYRAGREPLRVAGKDVILVDDGIATGSTMRAAVLALDSSDAASVTVAVPVGPADTLAEFETLVDRVVCVSVPEPFWAVGQAYDDFTQTSDDEVRRLLGAG